MTTGDTSRTLGQRVMSGSVVYAAALGLNSVLVLVINALFARILTQEELGTYLLLLSLSITIGAIPQCGLQRTVVRRVAQSAISNDWRDVADTVVGAILLSVLACLTVSALIAMIPASWILTVFPSSNVEVLGRFLPVLLALTALRNVVSESFRGLHMVGWASFHSRLTNNLGVMCLALLGLGLWRQIDLTLAAQMSTIVAVVALAIASLHLLSVVRRHCGSLRLRMMPELLRGGASITLITTLTMVSQEAHLWILSSIADASEAAVFGVVNRTVMLMTIPLLVMNGVVPQFIAELVKLNDIHRRNILVQVATFSGFGVALGMGICFWVFGRQILMLGFGQQFGTGYLALVIAVVGQVALGATASMTQLMVMTQHERPLAYMTIVSSAVGLLITYVSANSLGNAAGALGFMCGALLQSCSVWVYCVCRLDVKFPLGFGQMVEGVRVVVSMRKSAGR